MASMPFIEWARRLTMAHTALYEAANVMLTRVELEPVRVGLPFT